MGPRPHGAVAYQKAHGSDNTSLGYSRRHREPMVALGWAPQEWGANPANEPVAASAAEEEPEPPVSWRFSFPPANVGAVGSIA